MDIWAIANQKGGVGKTTSTMSIADALVQRGYRVLMLDLDPQGSLTSYLQMDPDEVEGTSFDLFDQVDRVQIRDTGFDNLKLVSASVGLANLEKRAQSLQGKGLVVAQWLKSQSDAFDYALIDTPPALGMLMVNALVACDKLIVPVQTDFLALKGLERMLKVLEMMSQSGRKIDYTLVATMFDQRTNASRRTMQYLRNRYPDETWPGVIPVDTKFREASRLGVPPSFLFKGSHGVMAYGDLVHYLLGGDEHVSADAP